MSVLKNKRNLSEIEFWQTFTNQIYPYFGQKGSKVSKRRRRYVWNRLQVPIDSLYRQFQEAAFHKNKDTLIHLAEEIHALEFPLYMYWVMEHTPIRVREYMTKMLNDEIDLLYKTISQTAPVELQILDLPMSSLRHFKTTSKLIDLLYYSTSKVIRANKDVPGTAGDFIVDGLCSALYAAVKANRLPYDNPEDIHRRIQGVEEALNHLRSTEKSIFSYILLMDYSEKIRREWIMLFRDVYHLLQAWLKHEKNRLKSVTE